MVTRQKLAALDGFKEEETANGKEKDGTNKVLQEQNENQEPHIKLKTRSLKAW